MAHQNGLFSAMIKAGKNTYFVNVNEAKNGNKYLSITESQFRPKEGGQVNGDSRKKTTIRVFGEAIKDLSKAVAGAAATL